MARGRKGIRSGVQGAAGGLLSPGVQAAVVGLGPRAPAGRGLPWPLRNGGSSWLPVACEGW